jgi:3-dehydroquinate synthase
VDVPLATVDVTASTGSYPVLVGRGYIRRLPEIVASRTGAERVALVSDSTVGPLHGEPAAATLRASGLDVTLFTIPAGEASKTRSTWASHTDDMLAAGLGRDSCVVAVGGGVTTDLGGFVAATYLRGVPVVQVPTSYLAMIDASVGGKTGVDVSAGKNLVGAFHPPRAVLVDPELVSTLPRTERAGGLVEGFKHGAILDETHFVDLTARTPDLLDGDPDVAAELVGASVRLKARVVMADEWESGYRQVLNFGHTIGHALEAASDYRLGHGSAVALGMLAEAEAGERIGVTEKGTHARLLASLAPLLRAAEDTVGRLDERTVIGYLGMDKKARRGKARYVLLERVGQVASDPDWSRELPDEVVAEVVKSVLSRAEAA